MRPTTTASALTKDQSSKSSSAPVVGFCSIFSSAIGAKRPLRCRSAAITSAISRGMSADWPSHPNGTTATGVRATPPLVISTVMSPNALPANRKTANPSNIAFLSTMIVYLCHWRAIVQV
jgi:hypothetical protein